ncbi:MAG: hypothetical protein IJ906_17010, partial [Oscillospiraceae bacterium]|nr:hypothetical protein [Oscillospiraceae bacterium]
MAVDIPTGVLQETKGMEKGFKKEGVLTYIDELTNKLNKLEERNADLEKEVSKGDSKLIEQYRTDLDNAQKKASEAIRQAQENANQLQAANDKAAQLAAALKTEKEERSTDAQKMKQLLQQAQAQTASADEGKMREYQEEILSLKSEISKLQSGEKASAAMSGKVKELEDKLRAVEETLSTKDAELAEKDEALGNMQNELNDLGGQIFAKDMQIDELQSKVEELENKPAEASFIAPEMDMSSIFAEAEKNANQLVLQAKNAADKMTRDADVKAKKTVAEADAKAQTTIREANEQAKHTTEEADAA